MNLGCIVSKSPMEIFNMNENALPLTLFWVAIFLVVIGFWQLGIGEVITAQICMVCANIINIMQFINTRETFI